MLCFAAAYGISLAVQRCHPDKYGPDFKQKARAKAVAMAMFFWFLLYPGLCLRWVKLAMWTDLQINGTKVSFLTEVRAACATLALATRTQLPAPR